MSDFGFDLRAYYLAMQHSDHSNFCFLNSFSEIFADHWLAKMHSVIKSQGVGLVGATGSWESMYSNVRGCEETGQSQSVGARLWRPFRLQLCKLFFQPFPNWHVRTNAFIISRELALRFWPRLIPTKRNAYLFEAGKKGLTARVMESGLDVFVIGRDGRAYSKEEWPNSKTYRAGNQENLLVADKQTDCYQKADPAERRHLAQAAWGDRAFE